MPAYSNLGCILDIVDIIDPCQTQTGIEFYLDDLGLSLATASKVADERYITGRNLVDQKKRIALDDVYTHLTRNVTDDCNQDLADGIMCNAAYVNRIARAVWYKTAALIFKEMVVDSSRYNEVIQFAGSEALAQLLYLDSSYRVFTTAESIPSGQYQIELERLEPVRTYIEQTCCVECTGSNWSITIP